jgi:hypothetical protein
MRLPRLSRPRSFRRISPTAEGFLGNGAAQESNLPSLGLPDLTGFEGLRESAGPLR